MELVDSAKTQDIGNGLRSLRAIFRTCTDMTRREAVNVMYYIIVDRCP